MSTKVIISSCSGVLSLLDEDESELQYEALKNLDEIVDEFWSEIANDITKIEDLCYEQEFKYKEFAARVASKVFYHLEDLDVSLKYALLAGTHFDLDLGLKNRYYQTLMSKCIDEYIKTRVKFIESKDDKKVELDSRLEEIVEKMFSQCYDQGQYKNALGVALESLRKDHVKHAILKSDNINEMLDYCLKLCNKVVENRKFRTEVLQLLVELYKLQDEPNFINVCQILLFLGEPVEVANVLDSLIKKDNKHTLTGYQVAFELMENQNQPFLIKVSNALPKSEKPKDDKEAKEDTYNDKLIKLKEILSGSTSIKLYLQFLFQHSKADIGIMKNIKEKLETRSDVSSNAAVMAHAIMNAGTTIKKFLEINTKWLATFQNWARFTIVSSTGVIHRGHHGKSLKLLQPYLPQNGMSQNPYQEGGALFALGLIHGNYSPEKTKFLLSALRDAGTNDIVQHGACLGIGLTGMATNDEDIFDTMKNIVYTADNATSGGEAAGIAIGLIKIGTGDGEAIEEVLGHAKDTDHERISRALVLGIALMCYAIEEEADITIDQLLADKDPVIRYGGVYAIAMAYVGTSNNKAIRKLLHISVSDVSNDVRRASVMSLGLVMCNEPEKVPDVVGLLSQSYNPYVRYGSALAIGIALAGTGNKAAIELIEPLLKDRDDFVRQGAVIGMSMVLMQQNKFKCPKVDEFRQHLAKNIAIKSRENVLCKFGCILASGIIDAGGRNCTIELIAPSGAKKMAAIVGVMMFTQYHYWFPFTHFISLSLQASAVIGLNSQLKMPKGFTIKSEVPARYVLYPEPVLKEAAAEKKKVEKATLSTTAKAKARAKKKEEGKEKEEEEKKDMEPEKTEEEIQKEKEEVERKKQEELRAALIKQEYSEMSNPSRILKGQLASKLTVTSTRYTLLKSKPTGICVLLDNEPDKEEELVHLHNPKFTPPGIDPNEPAPPKEFSIVGTKWESRFN